MGRCYLENRYTEPVFGPDALYALRRDAEYVRQAFLERLLPVLAVTYRGVLETCGFFLSVF